MKVFITTAGVEIPYEPVSVFDLQKAEEAVEREFREAGRPIDTPTYTVEVLEGQGEPEIHEHTPKTIEQGTEEEKRQWRLHIEAVEDMQNEIGRRTGLIMVEGILVDLPEDDSWIRRQKKLFNEDVPEDPDERKLYYVDNILLKTPNDKINLKRDMQMYSMTGANQEALDLADRLFQRQMADANRKAIEDLKAQLETQEDLVLQSETKGQPDGQSLGDVPVPISQPVNGRPSRNDSNREHSEQDERVGELSGPSETGSGSSESQSEGA